LGDTPFLVENNSSGRARFVKALQPDDLWQCFSLKCEINQKVSARMFFTTDSVIGQPESQPRVKFDH
jgi:hypothetical protein